MGLPNPGAEEEAALLAEARRRLSPLGVPLIASIAADTVEGFAEAAAAVVPGPTRPDRGEHLLPERRRRDTARCSPPRRAAAAEATRAAKGATSIPCLVKLSPNVADIAAVARAVAAAGADGITAVNTMPGMLVDAETGLPVLANRTGGISGPALKPVALRCVYEVCAAVGIPVIGTGGVGRGAGRDRDDQRRGRRRGRGHRGGRARATASSPASSTSWAAGWSRAGSTASRPSAAARTGRRRGAGRETSLPPVPGLEAA